MSFEKEYLISGSNGFLGKYFKEYFISNNIDFHTIGRDKNTNDLFFDFLTLEKSNFSSKNYKTFIQLASKVHSIPKTETEEEEFYKINLYGLQKLLDEFDKHKINFKNFVYISSVSVYGLTAGKNISENAPLKATDPYGKSKILAEELVQKWCKEKNINCTILRLPLVFGKNPPGNLGDLIEYLKKGKYFHIRKGAARKSIVLASDIPLNIHNFEKNPGIYNLTDRQHPSFKELTEGISKALNFKKPGNIPYFLLSSGAKFGDILSIFTKFQFNSSRLKKMLSNLTFNDDLAVKTFNWAPRKILDNLNELK